MLPRSFLRTRHSFLWKLWWNFVGLVLLWLRSRVLQIKTWSWLMWFMYKIQKKTLMWLSLKHTTNTCEHVRELVPGIYNRNQNERFIRICCILLHLFIGWLYNMVSKRTQVTRDSWQTFSNIYFIDSYDFWCYSWWSYTRVSVSNK